MRTLNNSTSIPRACQTLPERLNELRPLLRGSAQLEVGMAEWVQVAGSADLRQVKAGHQDAVGSPLQDLPHAVVEAQGGPVQRAVDLTPVQPAPDTRTRGTPRR